MNIYHSFLYAVIASLLLVISNSQATNITISIEGEGSVNAKEFEKICTKNCTFTNSLNINTFIPTAKTGWSFTGWSGQQCDSGSQVLISDSYKRLSGTKGGAKTIKTGDVNGDGLDDFVIIGLFNGEISLKTNLGNGQFNGTEIDINKHYPTALDLFDSDNDGDLDLYLAEFGSGVIKIYLNDGLGLFTFSENIKIDGIKPYSFKVLDKNGDGQNDLLISSFTADISEDLWVLVNTIKSPKTQWYLNNSGSYTAEQVISEEATMTMDAYKKDGVISVVAAEIENGVVAHYRSGIRTIVSRGGGAYGAAFGDIDRDGNMDVLGAHYLPPKLNLVYGNNNRTFTAPTLVATPEFGVTGASFGDFNNDGLTDAATSEFNKKLFYYFPTSSYKHCVISTEGDILLTATFIVDEIETPDPNKIPEPAGKTASSSGGGMSYLVLIYSLVALHRRNALLTLK